MCVCVYVLVYAYLCVFERIYSNLFKLIRAITLIVLKD